MREIKQISKKSSTEVKNEIIRSIVEDDFYMSVVNVNISQIRLDIYHLNPFVKDD